MTASSTRKDKIKIEKGNYDWKHFRPIVQFCLENGCEFYGSRYNEKWPFTVDRGGESLCTMYGPVTPQDIRAAFELPNTFELSDRISPIVGSFSIKDDANRTTFRMYSFEGKAQHDAKNAAYLEKEKARMAARRARMQREGEK